MASRRYSQTGRELQSIRIRSLLRANPCPAWVEGLERRTLLASIVGTVFNDANGDSQRQDGEEGMAGWRVYLDSNGDRAFRDNDFFAITDADGRYAIEDLDAGTYLVRETLEGGYVRTTPGSTGTVEVTLGADGRAEIHFGNRQEGAFGGAIRGVTFNDLNGDKFLNHGEPGMADCFVFLDEDHDNEFSEGDPFRITDSQGEYFFDGLEPRPSALTAYRVFQIPPAGWVQNPPTGRVIVEMAKAHASEGINFGNLMLEPGEETANILGLVYEDANGDGFRQDGETGLAGRTIYLDLNSNAHLDDSDLTATTGPTGTYAFENVPGDETYVIRQVVPDGWEIVRPEIKRYEIRVERGQTVSEYNFGNKEIPPVLLGTLRGTVFNDVNADGVWQDGEPGLGGRTVYLDLNDDGHRGDDEPAATTDSLGRYGLEEVRPGTYHVRQAVPDGTTLTAPASGVYSGVVGAGQTVDGLRFGNHRAEGEPTIPPTRGSIRGVVFDDRDGDGSRGAGEPGLVGWVVYVDGNRNGKRDGDEHGAFTDADGRYAFEDLLPGEYRMRQVMPEGWTLVRPADGFYHVTLAAGQAADERSFANRRVGGQPPAVQASIRGVVFNDRNGDGTRQDGEAGLGGRVVYLDQNTNGHRDAGEHAAETDGEGRYAFEGLAAGSYRVVEVAPAGWTIIRPTAGFYDLELLDGQRADDAHFANRHNEDGGPVGEPPVGDPDGEIVGEVFDDVDADGIHDEGEAGVARARVFVDVNGNGRRDRREVRAVTDASGAYRLVGVPAGDHVVKHVAPKGFRAVASNDGAPVSVTAGGSAAAGRFAVTRKSLLRGTVFHDATGNRALDAGEGGQVGLTMFLDLNRNNLADIGEPTALTDAAGRYSFLVDRGGYRVGAILPDGWRSTSARDGMFQVKVGSGRVVERDLANVLA